MASECFGRASKPRWVRVVTANVAEKLTDENFARKKIMVENRGPGTAFLSPQDDPAQNRGIRLLSGDTFVDVWEFNHVFEWYVTADVANTDIIVTEWTEA